ncbi:DUF1284 domain-containing protein [Aquisalibacillus elongatus]|uniref:DUF1284 domain-containing protein n=1 Tax=Aquisalibacillus elongatus TaxID=485577 RepID=UPI000F522301|nr:DUF1284 domain-containing protein [Aquisalibacillus elongatus]
MYKLRGHHLFCLLGYRGMGYSEDYVKNMTKIHQSLKHNPMTQIKIVKGPDQLCEKFPETGNYHCQDVDIFQRDEAILAKLGLEIEQVIRWEDVVKQIQRNVKSSDIQTVCQTCSWRSYGVCEEGVQELIDGKGLRTIGDSTNL